MLEAQMVFERNEIRTDLMTEEQVVEMHNKQLEMQKEQLLTGQVSIQSLNEINTMAEAGLDAATKQKLEDLTRQAKRRWERKFLPYKTRGDASVADLADKVADATVASLEALKG